jgi:hypothetical protein
VLRVLRKVVGIVLVAFAAAAACVTVGMAAFFLSDVGPSDSGPDPAGALKIGFAGLACVALASLVAYRLLSDRPRR